LVLAEALSRRGVAVSFVGSEDGFEALLVPKAGYTFHAVRAQAVFGAGIFGPLRIPNVLRHGMAQARTILRRERATLAIGFGGHASVAPMLAARSLGIPTTLYEANVQPGLANWALARVVDRVHVADSATRWPLRPRELCVTGHPIRRELDLGPRALRDLPTGRRLRILVLGGSQGSGFLNERVPTWIAQLAARGLAVEVWHQVGFGVDTQTPQARYETAGVSARVDRYLSDMAPLYHWADFVISAAGAGTLAEIAAMGLPSLLIPLAHAARNHQQPNAEAYAQRAQALMSTEAAFDAEFMLESVYEVLTSPAHYQALALAAKRAHQACASERLLQSCLSLSGFDQTEDVALTLSSTPFERSADNDVASSASSASLPLRSSKPRVHSA
jgi:UDP-N-acetylglucosamine--N-acetylmuramyl-(pentapeptide) pyrophosphoryl-undecaprenol N-acetylglucosamine transferase